MNNPRDFIPAKYKKSQIDKAEDSSDNFVKESEKINSPWSDLAKEPEIPEYRSDAILDDEPLAKAVEPSDETVSVQNPLSTNQKPSFQVKKKSNNKLAGLLIVFFLVIGVFSSYILSRQNQDNRQQASEACMEGDPYCNGTSGRCIAGYRVIDGACTPTGGSTVTPTSTVEACGPNLHRLVAGGPCVSTTCRIIANGDTMCGYVTDQDPCTEQSMGGDWCDNPNTSVIENCEESGLMRCQCSAGWWVIGSASSCDALCGDAGADCSDCATPTPTPTNPPNRTPTPTPTTPPELLACGVIGCTQNSDCQNGLTCQTVTVDSQSTGICAKGENQLFCAADPSAANCCESQAMPVCASIDMLDANNNTMEANDDDSLKDGDEVRFRCTAVGNQGVDFNYEFRIWAPGMSSWINLTDTSGAIAKNVSDSYTISSFGDYVVQGRICWGTECQVWEMVDNSPSTMIDNVN